MSRAGVGKKNKGKKIHTFTANEGPVRIQYKCLYIFPEMKLCTVCSLLISKQNYNVLSPNSYTHTPVRDLYISRIGLSILLMKNKKNFFIYKEIRSGAVAKSYMTNGLLMYGEIFAHFLIY